MILFKWLVIIFAVGALSGLASALFLTTLDYVTCTRDGHLWLIALLPFAGFFVSLLYHIFGPHLERGNTLVIEEIHEPRAPIPLRLLPLVFFGTLTTHLFGGSAGREGTAIQMGASLSDFVGKWFRLNGNQRRLLLMLGMSAGFGSVFGTPWAGTVFSTEILIARRTSLLDRGTRLVACFLAGVLGDQVTRLAGIHHIRYTVGSIPEWSTGSLSSTVLSGIIFGMVSLGFIKAVHFIKVTLNNSVTYPPLRPFLGGVAVAVFTGSTGLTELTGLSLPTLSHSFSFFLPVWTFLEKTSLTVLTLGSGFKGGDVTPLFVIGATLGNALSQTLPVHPSLLSAMGLTAVFGGVTKTPLTAIILYAELFGINGLSYGALACLLSYFVSSEGQLLGMINPLKAKSSAPKKL
jgi:H+/Cl- antiporter ClcA